MSSSVYHINAENAIPNSRLRRVFDRPNPADWADDELLSLAEAAALLFPNGPLTERKLRTAADKRRLAIANINGNIFTTKSAVRDLCRCSVPSATLAEAKTNITKPTVVEQADIDSRESFVLAKLSERKSLRR